MGLEAFTGNTLASIRTGDLSAVAWPFERVAPITAYVFSSTRYRDQARTAFRHLKQRAFEALHGCASLDDIVIKGDMRLLAHAYHRALLETLAASFPEWTLHCSDRGYFYLRVCGSGGERAVGEQFGMLAVFPSMKALTSHLGADYSAIGVRRMGPAAQ